MSNGERYLDAVLAEGVRVLTDAARLCRPSSNGSLSAASRRLSWTEPGDGGDEAVQLRRSAGAKAVGFST